MTQFYPATPSSQRPATAVQLPASPLAQLRRPENYLRDPGLVDAVNVALMLRQPLMVTGEPGTGKTVLAASIAWELGLEAPLVFETKSTSQAKDLFYTYDTLGRFTAKELETGAAAPQDYVVYNALGEAIILGNDPEKVREVLPSGYAHPGKKRSVVLIDEVEKAPRDFPNDILNEIERMFFRIPELGNKSVGVEPGFDPVVIMTNNSEKSLPDAFLRRCIYYHIPFPTGERLEQIVLARLPEYFANEESSELVADAVNFTVHIRDEIAGLEKKPGTAEMLNWLSAMLKLGAKPDAPLQVREQREIASRAFPSLVKISGDQERVAELLGAWGNGQA